MSKFAEVLIDGRKLSDIELRALDEALSVYISILQLNFTEATSTCFFSAEEWLTKKKVEAAKRLIAEAQVALFGSPSKCLTVGSNVTKKSALQAAIIRAKLNCEQAADLQQLSGFHVGRTAENRIIGRDE